jgi:hypothetical protein
VIEVLLLLIPAAAYGQEPNEEARIAFESGIAAAQRDDWEEARVSFERAYQLAPRPRVLLNLAGAQVHTGRLLAAAEGYRRFLALAADDPSIDATLRDGAENALREVERRLPLVRYEVEGIGETDQVLLDGNAVAAPAESPVDPGRHRISVVRDGEEIASETFTAAEGERMEVALSVPSPPAHQLLPEVQGGIGAENEAGERTFFERAVRSPWTWIAVAAVVLGAVVIGVAAGRGGGSGVHNGSLDPGRLEIR